jgi:hypothetical protein
LQGRDGRVASFRAFRRLVEHQKLWLLGDILRPKSFAGLFGAAPSIALATLLITLSHKGAPFAAVEGRSMIVGAFALASYSWVVCVLLKKYLLSSSTATTAAMVIWFVTALGGSAVLFQVP